MEVEEESVFQNELNKLEFHISSGIWFHNLAPL